MERENAWKSYTDQDKTELTELCEGYKSFLSQCKTERLATKRAIELASAAGYASLAEAIAEKRALKPGDKVWIDNYGKAIMLVQIGTNDIEAGVNILGAHIDSPRLDLKQNPLYEASDFVLLDTHYYGGIKNYQWVALPLALKGVGWHRGRYFVGRRSSRPGLLRDRSAAASGRRADEEEWQGSGGRRKPRRSVWERTAHR